MPNNSYYQPYGTYIGTNYPQPQQQTMQAQQPAQTTGGYICRPVTCREEAVAAQVDYFSAGLVMLDLAHGMIYVKRYNSNTGLSDWGEFKNCPPQPEAPAVDPAQFVTRKEFDEFARRMQAMKEVEAHE